MMTAMQAQQAGTLDESNGGRLVSTDGRPLPLREMRLRTDARGGLARVVLTQRFTNHYDDPLTVTYLLPLPADAAVSGFCFTIGERRVVGEVDRRSAARERFEQALVEGRSAALVEQDRSSLFTQEIGNIPPRTEIVAELTIDQRLAWLDEGAWEWRFPTSVAPRYQGAPGRVADAGKVFVEVADAPLPPRLQLELNVRDTLATQRKAESPSHGLVFETLDGLLTAHLKEEAGARLDRDVCIRWPVALPEVGLSVDVSRPGQGRPHGSAAYGLLTIVPPEPESRPAVMPRDLIVLLDTSGSMSGEPLQQACKVVSALVESLRPQDRLELIEFSNSPRRWKGKAVEATESNRKEAVKWLKALRASGSTEMRDAIYQALEPLRGDAQRQVVLVTDGLIGFESEVVSTVLEKLPPGSRLHTVGVGASVNRSLTQAGARAGRGLEVVIGLGEDPERAAQRLLARTNAPLVTELEVSGSATLGHAPAQLPDLFAGAPVLVALKLRPEGGVVTVKGKVPGGVWESRVQVGSVAPGEGSQAATVLFGRECVEDLEMRIAAGKGGGAVDKEIEQLGLDFQIATRLTSWIAVSEQVDVDPTRPTRREKVPHELPHGMSVEGLGLRAVAAPCAPPAPCACVPGAAPRQSTKVGGVARGVLKPSARPSRSVSEDEERDASVDLCSRAPTPREKKESLGLLEKAKRLLTGGPKAPAPEQEAKVQAPPTARELHGRVVLSKQLADGSTEVVLEIEIADSLEWQVPTSARLVCSEGEVPATIDSSRTTGKSSLAAGQRVRVVVKLASSMPGMALRLELASPAGELKIALR